MPCWTSRRRGPYCQSRIWPGRCGASGRTRPLVKACKSAAGALSGSEDPTGLGKRLHGEHAAFYEYRLAGSYRLVYSVDRASRRAVLAKVGDHKELFGRDSR